MNASAVYYFLIRYAAFLIYTCQKVSMNARWTHSNKAIGFRTDDFPYANAIFDGKYIKIQWSPEIGIILLQSSKEKDIIALLI
jgi:hypothetical protein